MTCLMMAVWPKHVVHNEVKTNVLTIQRLCLSLTFSGPCIVIFSYNKTNKKHQFLKFILEEDSTDSTSVHQQESSTVDTAIGVGHTG